MRQAMSERACARTSEAEAKMWGRMTYACDGAFIEKTEKDRRRTGSQAGAVMVTYANTSQFCGNYCLDLGTSL